MNLPNMCMKYENTCTDKPYSIFSITLSVFFIQKFLDKNDIILPFDNDLFLQLTPEQCSQEIF